MIREHQRKYGTNSPIGISVEPIKTNKKQQEQETEFEEEEEEDLEEEQQLQETEPLQRLPQDTDNYERIPYDPYPDDHTLNKDQAYYELYANAHAQQRRQESMGAPQPKKGRRRARAKVNA
jgi:hypothetical protein